MRTSGLIVAGLLATGHGFMPKSQIVPNHGRGARGSAGRVSVAMAADTPWALSEFLENVDKGSVEKVMFSSAGDKVLVLDEDGGRHAVSIIPSESPDILSRLRSKKVSFAVEETKGPGAAQTAAGIAGNLAFPLLLLGGLFFLNRRGGGGGMGGGPGGPMDMLKSKSKIELEPQTGVKFADVAGCDESKLELTEVVDFLKFPEKYNKLGAKTPRGVLLEGPPGTGKTLIARATAGEAGVPFISCSGSEFVEMFVGVGASRIRNLFADAKKNAPCIIFIDEIDAIGRQRASGGGMAGTNDEREQTLNQILTEMDGFSGNSGVIVLAATNRGDILDSALLRPGRFDRRVPVGLPDKKGREEILKVHVRNRPLEPEVDLEIVAGRTIGMSGAQLQNLMNEAAIMAARRGRETISFAEIDYALDRLTVGLQKTTGTNNANRQRLVSYHEAGHAVMAALTPGYDTVAKVTIIPRSNGAGGFTLFTPSEARMESGLYSKRFLKGQLAVALGGRCAEEIVFGAEEITTGASNDLQQVRNIARRMVAQWGFATSETSAVAWDLPEPQQFGPPTMSAETEKIIDAEVAKIVQEAYETCLGTLKQNRELMDALVAELLELETVDTAGLDKLVKELGNGVYGTSLELPPTRKSLYAEPALAAPLQ